jgi:hypothetical protein
MDTMEVLDQVFLVCVVNVHGGESFFDQSQTSLISLDTNLSLKV